MAQDIKSVFAAGTALTISLASLASSASGVAGRESTHVANTSNLYWDYLVAGKIRVGNTIGAPGTIEVWAYAGVNDTPAFPYAVTGSDAAVTFNTRDDVLGGLRLLYETANSIDANRTYWVVPVSIREVFGFMPTHFGIVVINRANGALSGTGADHAFYAMGYNFSQG